MTAFKDRARVGGTNAAEELAYVKLHLRVDHAEEDGLILNLILGSKGLAEAYLQNPFTDSASVELPIPETVKTWILEHVAKRYERRAEGLESAGIGGLTGSTKWTEGVDYSLLEPWRLVGWF